MSEPPPSSTREIVGHPRHTGRYWFDFAAASAAIFISIVSLIVAISGERTQSELLAANSWPFLQVDEIRTGDRTDAHDDIDVTNDGVGPAKVESFEVFYDGEKVPSLSALFARCCAQANGRAASGAIGLSDGDVAGNVLRASERLTMLSLVRRPENLGRFDQLTAHLPRIGFRACYCSVLDHCWSSDLRSLSPRRVASCRKIPSFRNDE